MCFWRMGMSALARREFEEEASVCVALCGFITFGEGDRYNDSISSQQRRNIKAQPRFIRFVRSWAYKPCTTHDHISASYWKRSIRKNKSTFRSSFLSRPRSFPRIHALPIKSHRLRELHTPLGRLNRYTHPWRIARSIQANRVPKLPILSIEKLQQVHLTLHAVLYHIFSHRALVEGLVGPSFLRSEKFEPLGLGCLSALLFFVFQGKVMKQALSQPA